MQSKYRYFKYKIVREGHLIYTANLPYVAKYENDWSEGREFFIIVEDSENLEEQIKQQPPQIEFKELDKNEFYKCIECFYDREFKEWQPIKKQRDNALQVLKIGLNGIILDANEEAMNRINRILSVANVKFNKELSKGTNATLAYESIYHSKIEWKDSKNKFVEVSVEYLAEFLELALFEQNRLWRKYVLPKL
ncbi:hypothetical protein [Helicobacter sp. WB40]|uniref:hypothetical protein n=1 Tax=Helicobacter sp. WB40 TaxID=3004130 RepID=UPI0022EBC01D|nr:hypothetical protein [Helicobacter sp. WB40]MDA3967370.1 hypothetical protein [Helicobacter sp. WB40]